MIGRKKGWTYEIDQATGKERFTQPGGIESSYDTTPSISASDLGERPDVGPGKAALEGAPEIDSMFNQKFFIPETPEERSAKSLEGIEAQQKLDAGQYRKEKLAGAAASFALDLFNAQNKYLQSQGVARFNIMQARNQASDALFRGRQAALKRQSEGMQAGDQALLAMAAQGQDVGGAGVQRVKSSYEAVGLDNAMREEVNAIREALGFQLEEVGYEYQQDMAKTERDMSMISSGLNSAAMAYGVL